MNNGEMKIKSTLFRGIKLNQKFTCVVFIFTVIPIIALAMVLFFNTQRILLRDKTNEINKNLALIKASTEKTAELCNMTRQLFLNDMNLRSFLIRIKNEEKLSAAELIDFRKNGIGNLEKMINANPYLYQVRVYQENESIPEIMPILYHTQRMKRLSWAQEPWIPGQWQLGYVDRIFPDDVMKPVPNIMSLVTEINDYDYGKLGILEVAVKMDDILPGLNSHTDSEYAAFVKNNGETWFYEDGSNDFWNENAAGILSLLRENADALTYKSISGDSMILSAVYLEPLDGWYVFTAFQKDITEQYRGIYIIIFVFVTLAILFILLFIINRITIKMLNRFYKIVDTMKKVKEGSLDIRVSDNNNDEIGALGEQINYLLDQIIGLMDENVKKQLLAKNSKIRALQSQINAHFIYNTLESIKMMAEIDHKFVIADTITDLGDLLRYSMQWTSSNVHIEDEINNIKNYLKLTNLRFDFQSQLLEELSPDILKQEIPRLSLQPIIENAVKHGSKDQDKNIEIKITAEVTDNHLSLTITDNGKGMTVHKLKQLNRSMSEAIRESGESDLSTAENLDELDLNHLENTKTGEEKSIGLRNVNARIVDAFGDEYGLRFSSVPEQFTNVVIRIPYHKTGG